MHIGVVGCGQLARMLALAGWNMGLEFTFLAQPGESTRCVRGLGRIVHSPPGEPAQQLYTALGEPAVITVEREEVDTRLLRELQAFCPVYPDPDVLHLTQHRVREKQQVQDLGLATAPFVAANSSAGVRAAVEQLGYPVVVKCARGGYDGRGQWHIHNAGQLDAFCADREDDEWLVESRIDFNYELSVIAARSPQGEVAIYPPTENHHQEGILLTSVAPARNLSAGLQQQCHDYIGTLLRHLDYVGVLAMECFVTEQGLMVNELAPRVHNSGHWTLRSEATSQFENHLRAILGMRLGSTEVQRYNGIINILGHYHPSATLEYLSPDSALTLYNKTMAPGRKLGHINVWRDSREDVLDELGRLHHCLSNSRPDDPRDRAH